MKEALGYARVSTVDQSPMVGSPSADLTCGPRGWLGGRDGQTCRWQDAPASTWVVIVGLVVELAGIGLTVSAVVGVGKEIFPGLRFPQRQVSAAGPVVFVTVPWWINGHEQPLLKSHIHDDEYACYPRGSPVGERQGAGETIGRSRRVSPLRSS